MPNSPRVTRGSLRHLSLDYAWDVIEPTSSQLFAADLTVKEKKGKKIKKGAIPKTGPSGVTPVSLPESQFPVGSSDYDQEGTPPSTRDVDEITCLQLLKDNNDREIRKLELVPLSHNKLTLFQNNVLGAKNPLSAFQRDSLD